MTLRQLAVRHLAASRYGPRQFHASRCSFIKVGDRLPDLPDVLMENSPGNKVNLAEELASDRGLIIGVPAAFSECGMAA